MFNGLLAETAKNSWVYILMLSQLCLVVLAAATVVLTVKMRKIKRHSMQTRRIDSETGIGNLSYFEYRFETNISHFSRNRYYLAYFILDGNYLHESEDEGAFIAAIKGAAELLENNVKQYEFVARITESGFAAAIQSSDENSAKERIEEIMQRFESEINIGGKDSRIALHCVLYHLNEDERDLNMLLFNMRRNCARLLNTDIQIKVCTPGDMNRVQNEKEMRDELRRGFEREEFKPYLQFIVNSKDKKIVSAEALSRWENPKRGILPPGKYIGELSRCEMIVDFDYYMFEKVCKQLDEWNGSELGHISISCNITRTTISEADFIEKIESIAQKYTFDREKLIIEITEDAMEKNLQCAMDNVSQCKKLGFSIALDDLGSGYTSLVNLCEYPIDIVKIDRDILQRAHEKKGRELFNGIIALSHSLNLKVVCEGVENQQHLELVESSHCDYIQGWYFSRAIPTIEARTFVSDYSCGNAAF